MKLGNIIENVLIVVKDIEKSKAFYLDRPVFGHAAEQLGYDFTEAHHQCAHSILTHMPFLLTESMR